MTADEASEPAAADAQASPFATKPILSGGRVTLRPFTPEDLGPLGAILADPEVLLFTGSVNRRADAEGRSPVLDARTRDWYLTRNEQPNRLDLAVVDRATGVCVGEVVLNEWEPANQACSFRTLLGPGGRGRGLGTEAIALLIDYVFENTDIHRIGLEVYACNPRAQRVYEKVGFTVEGRKRDALVVDGERIDDIVMSILRPDWERRRDAG